MADELIDILSNDRLTQEDKNHQVNHFLLNKLKTSRNFLHDIMHYLSVMNGNYGSIISASTEVLRLVVRKFLEVKVDKNNLGQISKFLYVFDKIGIDFDEIEKLIKSDPFFKKRIQRIEEDIEQTQKMCHLFNVRLTKLNEDGNKDEAEKVKKSLKKFNDKLEKLILEKDNPHRKLVLEAFDEISKLPLVKKQQLDLAVHFVIHSKNLGIFIESEKEKFKENLFRIIESIISSPHILKDKFHLNNPIAQVILYVRHVLKLSLDEIRHFKDFENNLAKKLKQEKQNITVSNIQFDVFEKIVRFLSRKPKDENDWEYSLTEGDDGSFDIGDYLRIVTEGKYGRIGDDESSIYVKSCDIMVTDKEGNVVAFVEVDGPSHDLIVDGVRISSNSKTKRRDSLTSSLVGQGNYFVVERFDFNMIRSMSEPDLFRYFEERGFGSLRGCINEYYGQLERVEGISAFESRHSDLEEGGAAVAASDPLDKPRRRTPGRKRTQRTKKPESLKLFRKVTDREVEDKLRRELEEFEALEKLRNISDRLILSLQEENIDFELIIDLLDEYRNIFQSDLIANASRKIPDPLQEDRDLKIEGMTIMEYVINKYLTEKSKVDDDQNQKKLELTSKLYLHGFQYEGKIRDQDLAIILGKDVEEEEKEESHKAQAAARKTRKKRAIRQVKRIAQHKIFAIIDEEPSPAKLIGRFIHIISNTVETDRERLIQEILTILRRKGRYKELFKISKYYIDRSYKGGTKTDKELARDDFKKSTVPLVGLVVTGSSHEELVELLSVFSIKDLDDMLKLHKSSLELCVIDAMKKNCPVENITFLVRKGLNIFSPISYELKGQPSMVLSILCFIYGSFPSYSEAISLALEMSDNGLVRYKIHRDSLESIVSTFLLPEREEDPDNGVLFVGFMELLFENKFELIGFTIEDLRSLFCSFVNFNVIACEEFKNWQSLELMCQKLLRNGVTKDDKDKYETLEKAIFNKVIKTGSDIFFEKYPNIFLLFIQEVFGNIEGHEKMEEEDFVSRSVVFFHGYFKFCIKKSRPINPEMVGLFARVMNSGLKIKDHSTDLYTSMPHVLGQLQEIRGQEQQSDVREPAMLIDAESGLMILADTIILYIAEGMLDEDGLRISLDNLKMSLEIIVEQMSAVSYKGLQEKLVEYVDKYCQDQDLNSKEYILCVLEIMDIYDSQISKSTREYHDLKAIYEGIEINISENNLDKLLSDAKALKKIINSKDIPSASASETQVKQVKQLEPTILDAVK